MAHRIYRVDEAVAGGDSQDPEGSLGERAAAGGGFT